MNAIPGRLLPDVFLPYQQQLMASVSHHAVTVVEKSRRTGYSWAAGAIAVLTAAALPAAGGSDVLYMGYNLEMAREFIDYVAEWARQISPAAVEVREHIFTDPDRPDQQIKAFRVEFASGHKVLALPSVPRALRGMQGLVIIDEAAFHDELDALLKAAFALLIWGGKVLIISTHNGDTNPFNVLVQDIRAGRKPYHLLRCTFDDALADGLYRRIQMKAGKPWSPEAEAAWRAEIIGFYGNAADEELHVIPSPSSGSAIPAPLIEARMHDGIPVLELVCKPDFVHWADHLRQAEIRDWCEAQLAPVLARLDPSLAHAFGFDFGRSGDLSVIWPMAIGRDLVRRTPLLVEMRGVPFQQQEQVLFFLVDRLPRFRAGKLDARGNGQYLAERAVQRYGAARIEAVMLSEGWYREHMPPFKAAFEDATITVPRNAGVLADLRSLAWVRGVIRVPETRATTEAGQRHGDAAVAGALGYAASRAEPEEYGYRSAAPAAGRRGMQAPTVWPEDRRMAGELRGSI
jgi:phage FluMu gp28-like protein